MRISDWSSDVCSSDLIGRRREHVIALAFDDRAEWMDQQPRLDLGPGKDQAADRDAMPRDRRLQRMIVRTETRPFVDRQSVHPGEPRPSLPVGGVGGLAPFDMQRSEEHTSELQSLMRHSYDVFCL